MTGLADKEQPFVRAIVRAGEPTARAGLARIGRLDLDAEGTGKCCLVRERAVQFSERPFAGVPIRFALLPTRLFTLLALGALADAVQAFQADEALGVGINDALADHMIGIQLQPSLSPADRYQLPSSRASAFALKSFAKSGIMIGSSSHLLSRIELSAIGSRCYRCQIALAHIYPQHLLKGCWCGVRGLDFQGNEQIEPFFAPVIPEFGRAYRGPLVQEGDMPGIPLIGHDHTTLNRQDAHLLVFLQRIIAVVVVGERGGDVVRWFIQALVALLGPACSSRLLILAPFGPQPLVGGSHLPRHIAGHLCGQAVLDTYLVVVFRLQALPVTRFAVGKGVPTHRVQGISIRQLGVAECPQLIRRRGQFQFGRQGGVHPCHSIT